MVEEDGKKIVERFIDTIKHDVQWSTLEVLRQQPPYNSIMTIILHIWSEDRREMVTKDLKLLRLREDATQVQHCTLILWQDLNVKPYYDYVRRHKSYVERCYHIFNETIVNIVKQLLSNDGLLLTEYEPEIDPSREQIERHDDSKYEFTETVTYAQRWYPSSCLGKPDEKAWQVGLEHHYCHNEHHPQYWRDRPMPWRYILEAVYDMGAMELERKFNGAVPEDRTRLLMFSEFHLERFRDTHQHTFLKKLLSYTTDQYNRSGCG